MEKKNKCHPELPHMAKGMCKLCYLKHYRENPKNKAKAREAHRKWESHNRDYRNLKSREWHISNPDKVKETKKKYVGNNLHKYRFYCAKRKSAKLQRTPVWSDISLIREFYLNCPEGKEVDHIIPLQGKNVSGLHVPNNLQYLTKEENCKKHNKFEEK